MLLSAFLVAELLVCAKALESAQIRLLGRIDFLYYLTAMLVLATGVARVFLSPKGVAFYAQNPVFWIKVALFVAVALVSIPPTLQFTRWRKALRSNVVGLPSGSEVMAARRYIVLELVLLALIPLCAVLMARGIGLRA
jgi:putative membrane protein